MMGTGSCCCGDECPVEHLQAPDPCYGYFVDSPITSGTYSVTLSGISGSYLQGCIFGCSNPTFTPNVDVSEVNDTYTLNYIGYYTGTKGSRTYECDNSSTTYDGWVWGAMKPYGLSPLPTCGTCSISGTTRIKGITVLLVIRRRETETAGSGWIQQTTLTAINTIETFGVDPATPEEAWTNLGVTNPLTNNWKTTGLITFELEMPQSSALNHPCWRWTAYDGFGLPIDDSVDIVGPQMPDSLVLL